MVESWQHVAARVFLVLKMQRSSPAITKKWDERSKTEVLRCCDNVLDEGITLQEPCAALSACSLLHFKLRLFCHHL
jgi:hypothetical protein